MAQRPENLKPPAYLSPNPPVPQPDPIQPVTAKEGEDPLGLDPTRFGDWTLKGIAVDF